MNANYQWVKDVGAKDLNTYRSGDLSAASCFDENGNLYLVSTDSFSVFNNNGMLMFSKRIMQSGEAVLPCIYVDKDESIYIAGYFTGVFDASIKAPDPYLGQYRLLKFTNDGSFLWIADGVYTSSSCSLHISCDTLGNAFVGVDYVIVDLPNPPVEMLTLSKYNSVGVEQWTKNMGGNYKLGDLQVSSDAIYIVGFFKGEVSFGSLAPENQFNFPNEYHSFLAQFSLDGESNWVKTATTNIPNLWSYYGSIKVKKGEYIIASTSVNDNTTATSTMKLENFDMSGTLQWTKNIVHSAAFVDENAIRDIFIDEAENIILTGGFKGQLDFSGDIISSNDSATAFLACYQKDGGFLWTKKVESQNSNVTEYSTGLAVFAVGADLYWSGDYFGTIDFNPESGVDKLPTDVIKRKFFSKLSDYTSSTKEIQNNSFSFYPNPCSSIVNLSVNAAQYVINDLAGKVVISGEGNTIDVSSLSPGIYTLSVQNAVEQFKVQKLLVQ